MTHFRDAVRPGEVLPPLTMPPLTRATLALYAGGSGDHIPLHIDSDFARSAGYPEVFMPGMLGMAYIARLLTQWVPQERVREIVVRFNAITYPGEVLTASGIVASVDWESPLPRARADVRLTNAKGEVKLSGYAMVDLDGPRGREAPV